MQQIIDIIEAGFEVGGKVESEKITRARGHADRPLSESELYDKFQGCLEAGRSLIAPLTLFDRLRHLEDISARELTMV